MVPFLIILFLTALLDWLAVARGWTVVEFVAKPAVVLLLLGWLIVTGLTSLPLICFALGIFFSLLGDVSLLFSSARSSSRWFMAGLGAFLLAHVAYIVGFNIPLMDAPLFWSIAIALLLAFAAARILQRLTTALYQKGLNSMARPVAFYGGIITLMLLSAFLALYSPRWPTLNSSLVALGAMLFYFSDIILAWNKFVTPIQNGRVINMVLYHLGQIALIGGVILQFGK
jgi:uncharacterized membrane protein YhhN